MTQRELYLQRYWRRYPPRPEGRGWAWGRFVQADPFTLRRGDQLLRCSLPQGWLEPNTDAPPWSSVLQTGDWVAVQDTAIVLLAPCEQSGAGQIPTWLTLSQWDHFLRATRTFFHQQRFVEVATPMLVESPGTEPFMDPFSVELSSGRHRIKKFLPFSPEFHLKKMVCQGGEKIFEIKKCFRNGEIGQWHQPEFWMLEWYQAFANLDELKEVLQQWLYHLRAEDLAAAPFTQVRCARLADLFQQHLQIELSAACEVKELRAGLKKLGVYFAENESWDDLMSRLQLELEPYLGTDGPLIVEAFPPQQAQLARLRDDGWADRFELYWQGVELANAFHELNDPTEQEIRFAEDLKKRRARNGPEIQLDPEFLGALKSGMPPTAGIAIGLERLFAVLSGAQNLQDVRPFPITLSITS